MLQLWKIIQISEQEKTWKHVFLKSWKKIWRMPTREKIDFWRAKRADTARRKQRRILIRTVCVCVCVWYRGVFF